MVSSVYKTIWLFIHLLFNIKDFFEYIIFLVKLKCKELWKINGKPSLSQDKQFIEEHKGYLLKIPVHIAVILGTEEPNFEALSRIVFWGLATGIQNISFYDHKGIV